MAESTSGGTELDAGASPVIVALPVASVVITDRDHAHASGAGCAEFVETQLRDVVERSWSRLASILDRLIASGRRLDREMLLDLAGFLESAWPAVRAYEQLVRRVRDEALATLEASPPPLRGDGA